MMQHSPLHTYTDGGGCVARHQLTHQEQWVAQGHFDMGEVITDYYSD